MNLQELHGILPLLVLTAGITLLLLQVSFWRGHRRALASSLLILTATIYACYSAARQLQQLDTQSISVTSLMLVDHTALFISVLMLLAAVAVAVLGFNHLRQRCSHTTGSGDLAEEFYILLLLVLLGACTLTFASHFAVLFLALELMGLALYPLLGFAVTGVKSSERERTYSLESGLKYLLLSALSTALGLFGIALIYAASGTLDFTGVASAVARTDGGVLLPSGLILLLVGIAFKLSLVPFHIWTPDVYQGAPTPVTALIATVGKGAVIAILLRLLAQLDLLAFPVISNMLVVLAIASMLIGNLLALMQADIKRLLAYSSIAHIGYLIVALMFGATAFGVEAVAYYLVAYVVTTLGAFAVVSLVADAAWSNAPDSGTEPGDAVTDPFQRSYYRGLFWRSPWLACCLAAMLLSLAGIPLTIGFIGKFYIFAAGVQAGLWLLLGAVVLGSALGLFYYLKLMLTMMQKDDRESPLLLLTANNLQIRLSGQILLICLSACLLVFGIFPQTLIDWIN
ncbi:NADH-quinone oxidoreductase subunit N [Microbulbifer sp. 2201CG32-9]|uniref:NADH-quinone oxidoreductase subunit N n=1 Tax=unclassified Microbulbifer TaxID=2619833 RepID=UPI00345C40E0